MKITFVLLILLTFFSAFLESAEKNNGTGILLLAHGGKQKWNEHVNNVTLNVNAMYPTEVAFGMANKGEIETAIQRLLNRNVKRIVVVPLFISSHSAVIRSTEYLLGLRTEKPQEVEIFARMDHGSHESHPVDSTATKPIEPIETPVPIQLTTALNSDPFVAEILIARALSISKNPASEMLVLVAHGPESEEDNLLWLKNMQTLAEQISAKSDFQDVQLITLRDDAPAEIRDAATSKLRDVVQQAKGKRVLIVPLLLSYGGIEEGIRKRLEGLDYIMPDHGLLPDERITKWVLQQAEESDRNFVSRTK